MTPSIPAGCLETGAELPGIGRLFAQTGDGEAVIGFPATNAQCGGSGVLRPAVQAAFAAHTGETFVARLAAPDSTPTLVSLTSAFLNSAECGQWIEGSARLVRRTRSLVFAHIEIRASGGVVMTAEGIWRTEPAKAEAPES